MQALIFILFLLLMLLLAVKGLIVMWHKMHALVGIEVGHPSESLLLPYQQGVNVPLSIRTNVGIGSPLGQVSSTKFTKKSRQSYWQTNYGVILPLENLKGIDVAKLNLMPQQAVEQLVIINDKMAQYLAWQQTHANQVVGTTRDTWLTEKQFVIERLIQQTIPEAVEQYDQLARFSPDRLAQPIHDNLTAGEILVAVLQTVDNELTQMLDEAFTQASSQLATTYRYVKNRVQ